MLSLYALTNNFNRRYGNWTLIKRPDLIHWIKMCVTVNPPRVLPILINQIYLLDLPYWGILFQTIKKKSLVIKSHGGSKTNDILKILNRVKNKEFGDLLIQVGSNDCATKKSVQEMIENFDKIVEAAKRVSSTGHVTLGGICPRTDDGDAAARGTEVNSRLQQLVETRGCVHTDHDGTFFCRNGDVNSALLLGDGLHLSEAGLKALLDNFNLSPKAHVRLGRGIRDRGPSSPPAPHATMYLSSMAQWCWSSVLAYRTSYQWRSQHPQKCLGTWPSPSPTQRRPATNVSPTASTTWPRHRPEGRRQQGQHTPWGRAWCTQVVYE